MKSISFKYVLAAVLVAAAASAFAGFPLISPDMLAGLSMLAMVGNVEMIGEIKTLIEGQGRAWDEFKTTNDMRFKNIEDEVVEIARMAGRSRYMGSGNQETSAAQKHGQFFDVKTKRLVPVLAHSDSLAALEGKAADPNGIGMSSWGKTDTPSVGRVLRGIVLGGRADDATELADERKSLGMSSDPAGGYTVAGALAANWIDALRAQMVLSRAGCRTIPMGTSTLSLARVVDDPTISWHAENAALGTGDPTFGAVNLTAKTCVCLVRLSLELSQDSANIEQILQSTINSAMAGAIDSAGLVGVTVDAGAAPAGVMNLANRNTVTSIGAPTSWDFVVDGMYELMLDNVAAENIGALIAHPAVWKKMRKLKTGITNDNTPLTMPAEVAALPKHWTTAAPLTGGTTAAGVIADWRDLLMGVRKDINVRVLSEAFMGSNLQVAVLAYARVDFAATRQQSFCTLEGITV